jgi:hypothetical protein
MSFIFRKTKCCVSRSYTNSNIGFIDSFELIVKMWKYSLLIQENTTALINLSFKSIFFLLIKPFLFIYSSKVSYTGKYTLTNNQPTDINIKKHITYRILYIPFFYSSTKTLNNNDWNFILKIN